ncbi:mycofactocin biosynthesis peptidyl-dipeptidase MftE [Pseudonocardia acaciae]|uniref:mycofactocin biosynthesis peptidyl-dipeptidase MftE n=1 Tax=Pseudonocardia acaciae TaxID=551276 RepID=UPI0006876617|nr:mycofactocin biosynthesis peptidyl-dipeptidase MftE [Pseudonocardia acaciae]
MLGERVWPEVGEGVTVLVPVGSVEQHGPHLPLDTDTRIAEAVARGAAARARAQAGADVLVAPAVAFGASGEHEGFAGTVSIGTDAVRTVLVELGRSAGRWARRLVFVNGHGGNVDALRGAVALLRAEGRDVRWYGCAPPPDVTPVRDAHAGRVETSLMLALAPDTVRLDLVEAGNTTPLPELMPALRAHGVAPVAENGVLGDPAGASASEGEAMLAAMVDQLCRLTLT